MENEKIYTGNGLTQAEYRHDKAQLDDFRPIESDWKEIFRWVISVSGDIDLYDGKDEKAGKLSDLWSNHILTVLVEIVQKDVEQYMDSFVEGHGTTTQQKYTTDLQKKVTAWMERIDNFLHTAWSGGGTAKNPAVAVAHAILSQLKNSLPDANDKQKESGRKRGYNKNLDTTNQPYFVMLGAVNEIKRRGDDYIRQIEESGDMDASLALLLTFVRNYCHIVQKFNRRFAALPDLYRKEILEVGSGKTVQDRTYVIICPAHGGFTLPRGTRFPAGTKANGSGLVYSTRTDAYITRTKIEEVNAVFLKKVRGKSALYKRPVHTDDPETSTVLFADPESSPELAYGWMIESHLFRLAEGKRAVSISFLLTGEPAEKLKAHQLGETDTADAFTLWSSGAEGWTCRKHRLNYTATEGREELTFAFTIHEDEAAPAACLPDIHGTGTEYPAVRIIASNKNSPYDWGSLIRFDNVRVDTEVEGIRSFSLYNESGEMDSAQPFYPFGTQAGQGSWFMFGNEEMAEKQLLSVTLKGVWNKLPQNKGGYAELYRAYPCSPAVTNESFRIRCEWQENNQWNLCADSPKPLFGRTDGSNKPDETAEISFDFTAPQAKSAPPSVAYEYRRGRKGFFRVTLQEPAMGFGLEEYRRLFADTLIYNSRHKEKEQKALPVAPQSPLLADTELRYTASERLIAPTTGDRRQKNRLWRMTGISGYNDCPIVGSGPWDFIQATNAGQSLQIGIRNADGDKKVRMYIDLSFVPQNIFSPSSSPENNPVLEWDYFSSGHWIPFPPESILAEETGGLTRSGFIEIEYPKAMTVSGADGRGLCLLRMRINGNAASCLAVRGIYINCLAATAENGDGTPLEAGTIQKLQEEDGRIESIAQPWPGYDGKAEGTPQTIPIGQSCRIATRNRAVVAEDYERLILEQFADVEKVCCLAQSGAETDPSVYVVVFSRLPGSAYPITPAWKLTEIGRFISAYASPFAQIQAINPAFEPLAVYCKAILKPDVSDKGNIIRKLTRRVNNYFAFWLQKGALPDLGQRFSYKELHTRLANDEDILCLKTLTVNGESIGDVGVDAADLYFTGKTRWSVLVPQQINIELADAVCGIDEAEIGTNFTIR